MPVDTNEVVELRELLQVGKTLIEAMDMLNAAGCVVAPGIGELDRMGVRKVVDMLTTILASMVNEATKRGEKLVVVHEPGAVHYVDREGKWIDRGTIVLVDPTDEHEFYVRVTDEEHEGWLKLVAEDEHRRMSEGEMCDILADGECIWAQDKARYTMIRETGQVLE